jgi:hypothetical protein
METDTVLRVLGAWTSWRSAHVRFDDLHDIHWLQPSGAPRPIVHGYISCSDILDGEIPHGCERTKGPHLLLVCILKAHTNPSAYATLTTRADRSRRRSVTPSPPNGAVA